MSKRQAIGALFFAMALCVCLPAACDDSITRAKQALRASELALARAEVEKAIAVAAQKNNECADYLEAAVANFKKMPTCSEQDEFFKSLMSYPKSYYDAQRARQQVVVEAFRKKSHEVELRGLEIVAGKKAALEWLENPPAWYCVLQNHWQGIAIGTVAAYCLWVNREAIIKWARWGKQKVGLSL